MVLSRNFTAGGTGENRTLLPMKTGSLLISLALFVIPALPHSAAGQEAQAEKYAREGVEAAKRKNWDKAIADLRKAMEPNPKDQKNSVNLALALQERGAARVQQKKYDEAIADLSESLKLNEQNVTAHRFRAFALLSKHDYENALKEYDTVLAQKHNDLEALERRGYVLTQLKRYDKAAEDYGAMIKEQPKDIRGYLGRSYVYELTNKSDLGLADVNKALELQPNNQAAQSRKKRFESMKPAAAPANTTANPQAAGANPSHPLPPAPVPSTSPR